MDILIVAVGLLIACSGVVLSWHQKGAMGIWATYAFGFLLVVTAGPLRGSLSGLSVTGKGLEVSFAAAEPSSEQVKAIESRARASIISLSPAEASRSNPPARQLMDKASQDVVDQLLPFIRSLGFVPTQIVGPTPISPGSVIALQEGRPITAATSVEAFPKLDTQSSSVAFPRFQVDRPLPGSSDAKVLVGFECKAGAQLVQASIAALESSANTGLLARFSRSGEYFVVQAVLKCNELWLASSTRGEGARDVARQDYEYASKEPVVLGYKLLTLAVSKQNP